MPWSWGSNSNNTSANPLPFNELLMDLGNRGATDLEIGELAQFVHQHL